MAESLAGKPNNEPHKEGATFSEAILKSETKFEFKSESKLKDVTTPSLRLRPRLKSQPRSLGVRVRGNSAQVHHCTDSCGTEDAKEEAKARPSAIVRSCECRNEFARGNEDPHTTT